MTDARWRSAHGVLTRVKDTHGRLAHRVIMCALATSATVAFLEEARKKRLYERICRFYSGFFS